MRARPSADPTDPATLIPSFAMARSGSNSVLALVAVAAACGSSSAGLAQSVSSPASRSTDARRAADELGGRRDASIHIVGVPGRLWLWATVDHASAVRLTASETAPRVGVVTTTTPEGTAGNVQILATQTIAGAEWDKVSFPSLPNGKTGWIPRTALGAIHLVTTQLTINRVTLRATLRRDGKIVFIAPVGVGRKATPTPSGAFFIRDELVGFGGSPTYGPIAFGTSARSATLTDWPAGGYIGIHGTDQPQLIPGRISHGCIRLRNVDIRRLARLMPVGSAVQII